MLCRPTLLLSLRLIEPRNINTSPWSLTTRSWVLNSTALEPFSHHERAVKLVGSGFPGTPTPILIPFIDLCMDQQPPLTIDWSIEQGGGVCTISWKFKKICKVPLRSSATLDQTSHLLLGAKLTKESIGGALQGGQLVPSQRFRSSGRLQKVQTLRAGWSGH